MDDLVREAITSAKENGYNFPTAREWAEDLVMFCADFEGADLDEVEAAVRRVLDGNV